MRSRPNTNSTRFLRAWGGELTAALESFRPTGAVLESACRTAAWAQQVLRHAAGHASPEMLAIAAGRVKDVRVRFVHADMLS